MKKFFVLFSSVLMAGAMMLVSCTDEPITPQTTQYTITVSANDNAMGTVTGGGTYDSAATVTLTATPNDGYTFANWQDGETANPRTIVVLGNATYTANFVPVITDHASVQFNTNTNWDATFVGAGTYDGDFIVRLYKDQTANDQPSVYMVSGKTVGTHTYAVEGGQSNGLNIFYFNYDDDYTAYNGRYYPTWQTASHTQTITAIDMNAQTFTYTSNSSVFNLDAYLNSGDQTEYALNTDVQSAWETIEFSKAQMPRAFVK